DALLDDSPDDDVSVSSDQPGGDDAGVAAPYYGEMEPPQRASGALELAPTQDQHASADGPASDARLLDAWYAEYSQPALAALMRRPDFAQMLGDLTGDTDDRALVEDTEAYPWRCICALRITAADGSRWLGTGWLAGPRTIVTAGHCVYLRRHGGWAREVEVIPGLSAEQRPYGACTATSFRSVRGWARGAKPGHNYGAVILPPDRAFGNLVGFFGFTGLADLDLKNLHVNLAGYPCDKPEATQWRHARPLDFVTPRTLEYRVDTLGGQSGAPVWQLKNGERYVVGIHVGAGAFGNAAIRITSPVFDNLSAWKREGA
ncbi:MAG TPA: serine protease, partial [Roseiflexaceae bacterium]|nr:serine protease [Roseiflexaceae bacterium]